MPTPGANRLSREKSPYLRQHAGNPVEWFPWGEEAFGKATRQNKPIFLSIGYSTCHWCHVMEKESFEDDEVARRLNENFVAVKVDREERPDIDAYYMSVCQLLTGSGGWPLTIFLTPEKKPFFAGTYFPKKSRFGLPGLADILTRLAEAWKTKPQDLVASAERISQAAAQGDWPSSKHRLGPDILDRTFEQLSSQFDDENGGFGRAPKFPTPHHLTFLLRYAVRRRSARALIMVEKTLRSMRSGGVFDQLGFGFHRYSTDARWLVPHFEKMIYDQALMTIACAETFQATANEEYGRMAEEIVTYILRDMTSDEGGFFTAEDADSEGEEGRFYLWEETELRDALSKDEADAAALIFNVRPEGNFEEPGGHRSVRNILHLSRTPAELAGDLNIPEARFWSLRSEISRKLHGAREGRPRPFKDTKILTDWNGLVVAALAKAGRALDRHEYTEAAARAAAFLKKEMVRNGRLYHRYAEGEVGIPAFLDDHAFLIWGLLELHQATFNTKVLEWALGLTDNLFGRFWDDAGGFFMTSEDAGELPLRKKEVYDGALPSGNSVMLDNLLRLGRLTGRATFEEKAMLITEAFSGKIAALPAGHTHFIGALDFAFGPAHEIVIAGRPEAPDTEAMLRILHREFLSRAVIVFRPSGQECPAASRLSPFARSMTAVEGRATAYLCSGFRCGLPVTDPAEMLARLKSVYGS
jgi:uncharacterized protein YyaL (SSP411 family)